MILEFLWRLVKHTANWFSILALALIPVPFIVRRFLPSIINDDIPAFLATIFLLVAILIATFRVWKEAVEQLRKMADLAIGNKTVTVSGNGWKSEYLQLPLKFFFDVEL